MITFHRLCALALIVLGLPRCSPSLNGTSFAPTSAVDSDYISKEYGGRPPNGTVYVQVEDHPREFSVWFSKTHPRILIKATDQLADKSLKSVVSFGLLESSLPEITYRQAAISYLANSKLLGCELKSGAQLLRTDFEWTYNCPKRSHDQ